MVDALNHLCRSLFFAINSVILQSFISCHWSAPACWGLVLALGGLAGCWDVLAPLIRSVGVVFFLVMAAVVTMLLTSAISAIGPTAGTNYGG